MDVAEAAVADPAHVGAAVFDPFAVEQVLVSGVVDREDGGFRMRRGGEHGALADAVLEEFVEVGCGGEGFAFDGEEFLARLDAGDVGGAEGRDGEDGVGGGVEREAEASGDGRGGGLRAGADAAVGGVQFADHQGDDAAEFIGRAGGFGPFGVVAAGVGPVGAVEFGVVIGFVDDGPGLVEDFLLFVVEVDVEFGGDGEGAGDAGVDGDDGDAAGFEVENLFAIGGEDGVGLGSGSGGELAGGGFAGEFVEGVGVEVLLADAGGGGEEERFAVRADDLGAGVDAETEEGEALPNAFEDDPDGRFRGGVFRCQVLRGGRGGVSGRGGGVERRGLAGAEEFAELVLAEAGGAGDEVDAGDGAAFGALGGAEEEVSAVGAPGDGVAVAVGEEAEWLFVVRAGGAVGWDDGDVAETAGFAGEIGQPLAVGRPGEGVRTVLTEQRGEVTELFCDEGGVGFGVRLEDMDFAAIAEVGQAGSVGRPGGAGVLQRAGGEGGFGVFG